MTFRSDELERVVAIARDATLGVTFRDRVSAVVGTLERVLPATSLSAILLEPSPTPEHIVLRNVAPESGALYAGHYVNKDPMHVMREWPDGTPAQLSDFVRDDEFSRGEFASDFLMKLRIRHILASSLPMPDGNRLAIALHRERGRDDFSRHERELLGLVAPEIARGAFGALVHEKLAAVAVTGPGESTGAIVLDASGDVRHANAAARALLEKIALPGRTEAIDRLVLDARRLTAGHGSAPTLERTVALEGGGWLRLTLSATGPGPGARVLAALSELAPGSRELFEAVATRTRLTPREREVASLAIRGLGNAEIGRKLGISAATVNVHLGRVYAKTGAPGRAELAALFRRGPDVDRGPRAGR